MLNIIHTKNSSKYKLSNEACCLAPNTTKNSKKIQVWERFSCVVCVREGRPPLLFIAMETSVLENISPDPACNHHEGATRRCYVEGGDGWCPSGCGRTLGAAVPRCGLPTTVFRMAVCSWARVASMSVLGPDSQGRWASLLVSLLCFVGKCIVVTFSTVFMYMY